MIEVGHVHFDDHGSEPHTFGVYFTNDGGVVLASYCDSEEYPCFALDVTPDGARDVAGWLTQAAEHAEAMS